MPTRGQVPVRRGYVRRRTSGQRYDTGVRKPKCALAHPSSCLCRGACPKRPACRCSPLGAVRRFGFEAGQQVGGGLRLEDTEALVDGQRLTQVFDGRLAIAGA